jgi:hypothetical protein
LIPSNALTPEGKNLVAQMESELGRIWMERGLPAPYGNQSQDSLEDPSMDTGGFIKN